MRKSWQNMMLGYEDIVKALGKDIGIFPFKENCIRGDSINLTISEYAWSLCRGEIWIDNNVKAYTQKPGTGSQAERYVINERETALIEHNQRKYAVILPNSTTLIETQEIIAVSNKIGGTYHSKVKIVSKGLCHIGTYLEPNYRGHSLIAIHNPGREAVLLKIGEVFSSITLFELKTPVSESLIGAPGSRFEILSQCNIHISEEEKNYLSEQWKNNPQTIIQKMKESAEYTHFIRAENQKRKEKVLKYFNWWNFCILIISCLTLIVLYGIAYKIDITHGGTIWRELFWNIGFFYYGYV